MRLLIYFITFILFIGILISINANGKKNISNIVLSINNCKVSEYQLRKNFYRYKIDFINAHGREPEVHDIYKWIEEFKNRLYFIEEGLSRDYDTTDSIMNIVNCMQYFVVGQEYGLFYQNIVRYFSGEKHDIDSLVVNHIFDKRNSIFNERSRDSISRYEAEVLYKAQVKLNGNLIAILDDFSKPFTLLNDSVAFTYILNNNLNEITVRELVNHNMCKSLKFPDNKKQLLKLIDEYVWDYYKYIEYKDSNYYWRFVQDSINYVYSLTYNFYLKKNVYNNIQISDEEIAAYLRNSSTFPYKDELTQSGSHKKIQDQIYNKLFQEKVHEIWNDQLLNLKDKYNLTCAENMNIYAILAF